MNIETVHYWCPSCKGDIPVRTRSCPHCGVSVYGDKQATNQDLEEKRWSTEKQSKKDKEICLFASLPFIASGIISLLLYYSNCSALWLALVPIGLCFLLMICFRQYDSPGFWLSIGIGIVCIATPIMVILYSLVFSSGLSAPKNTTFTSHTIWAFLAGSSVVMAAVLFMRLDDPDTRMMKRLDKDNEKLKQRLDPFVREFEELMKLHGELKQESGWRRLDEYEEFWNKLYKHAQDGFPEFLVGDFLASLERYRPQPDEGLPPGLRRPIDLLPFDDSAPH